MSSKVTMIALAFLAVGSASDDIPPTFNKEVAPILFKHCVNCHRPGEIASTIPLLSYDSVRPWAKALKQKVLAREMPPWPADPNVKVKFRNDARLSQSEIDVLVAWVNSGAPKGKDSDLPPQPKFVRGWQHPKGLAPDLVIAGGEFEVPATGELPYVKRLFKAPFSEDKWIAAIQARPGNRAVVHHMAITEIMLDDGVRPADLGPMTQLVRQLGARNDLVGTRPAITAPSDPTVYDMLGVYTPGSTIEMYPEGAAKLLKAGKNLYINFNIHYQPTGKPEKDLSLIAFWFLPGPPKSQMYRVASAGGTIIANGHELLTDVSGKNAEGTSAVIPPIPPHADNYEVIGITAYTQPVTIYQFQPHAHLRGKDFKYIVVYPDGREETVLNVPKYDFRWQLAYDLETPLKLPAGSKLVVTAHYDNSVNNKYNPAPEKEVHFRESQNQSWDEMFTPFTQYAIESQSNPAESVLDIVKVVGCLEPNPSGTWMLTNAGGPVVSKTQSTSLANVMAAQSEPLGDRRYSLVGVSSFHPLSHQGQKVMIQGVLINDSKNTRLNITSLQDIAAGCSAVSPR